MPAITHSVGVGSSAGWVWRGTSTDMEASSSSATLRMGRGWERDRGPTPKGAASDPTPGAPTGALGALRSAFGQARCKSRACTSSEACPSSRWIGTTQHTHPKPFKLGRRTDAGAKADGSELTAPAFVGQFGIHSHAQHSDFRPLEIQLFQPSRAQLFQFQAVAQARVARDAERAAAAAAARPTRATPGTSRPFPMHSIQKASDICRHASHLKLNTHWLLLAPPKRRSSSNEIERFNQVASAILWAQSNPLVAPAPLGGLPSLFLYLSFVTMKPDACSFSALPAARSPPPSPGA
ncbi:hypothetical protein L1887_49525 [Cichorium endivia]|nr:hypothetical protein L1887_49525 [Cichorium endivia]